MEEGGTINRDIAKGVNLFPFMYDTFIWFCKGSSKKFLS
jgi:hypothetical protein